MLVDIIKQRRKHRFHPKWRYNIRLAQRKGVEVRLQGFWGELTQFIGEMDPILNKPVYTPMKLQPGAFDGSGA